MEELLKEIEKFKKREVRVVRKCSTPNDIVIRDIYAEIILRNNKQKIVGVVKVDKEDLEKVKPFKWCKSHTGYAATSVKNKTIKMHMIILNQKPNQIGHHINRDSLDNRKSNLELLDKSQHTALLHRLQQRQRVLNLSPKNEMIV